MNMNFETGLIEVPIDRYQSYVPESNQERLLLSAIKGDEDGVKAMLDAGVDIETRDTSGKMAGLFKYFLGNGKTALHFACARNQPNVVRYLLERAKKEGRVIIYAQDSKKRPPLTDAIVCEALECISWLFKYGMDMQKFLPAARKRRPSGLDPSHIFYMPEDVEINPLMSAIYYTRVKSTQNILYFVGKGGAEAGLKENLLPFLPSDLVKIVASYRYGNCGEYLNNFDFFNDSPLRFAIQCASRVLEFDNDDDPEDRESAKRSQEIVELLQEGGAVNEMRDSLQNQE